MKTRISVVLDGHVYTGDTKDDSTVESVSELALKLRDMLPHMTSLTVNLERNNAVMVFGSEAIKRTALIVEEA